MCEPDINMAMRSHSPSPSTPIPRFQFAPNTPEISTRHSPELVKRMQESTCYRCGQIGHWSYYCQVSPPSTKRHSPSPNQVSPLNPQRIYCRCGHGFCLVKISRSAKNPGRKYYVCPIKRGRQCNKGKGFIRFCDDPIDESFMQPPPYKYPECECGAGVCGKEKDPDTDKYCFVCPVGQDHGSCGYRVWEDELLNNKSIFPVQQSSQMHDNLGEGGDLLVEHSERVTMMDNPETPLSTAISELAAGDDAASEAAPSRQVGFPEFEIADDLKEVVNSVPWDAVEKEALLLSRPSRPSRRMSCRQNLFGNNSFAGAATDASVGIFPSLDKIVIPKQAIIGNDPCERNQLVISNLNEHAQLSSRVCYAEVSGDVVGHTKVSRDIVSVSPIMSQGTKRKLMSKAERQRETMLFTLRRLLIDLEDLDPHDHESMRVAVEDTFAILGGLSADYKRFSEHVWDFINSASAIAETDKSIENSLALEECNQRIEKERARLAQIQEECLKAEAMLEASNQHSQRLREEVSHLEAMLHERRNQLRSCESESLKIEARLGDLKRRRVAADTTLKGRAEEAELARRLSEQRQTKQMAAIAALEKAKQELEN